MYLSEKLSEFQSIQCNISETRHWFLEKLTLSLLPSLTIFTLKKKDQIFDLTTGQSLVGPGQANSLGPFLSVFLDIKVYFESPNLVSTGQYCRYLITVLLDALHSHF